MTTDDLGSIAIERAGGGDRLAEIEALIHRVRAGEIDENTALSRIATLARSTSTDAVYQKPWG